MTTPEKMSSVTTKRGPDADVVVVGAGLAGLIAARELRDDGFAVKVLEARDRVGGRVFTDHFPGVGQVDLGAEWVSPAHHTAAAAEFARYGLGLEEPAPTSAHRWWLGGELTISQDAPLSEQEWEEFGRLVRILERDCRRIDFADPAWHRGVSDLDVPFSDYVAATGVPANVVDVVFAQAYGLMGAEPEDYSTLNLLHEISGFGSVDEAFAGQIFRLSGGMGRLPEAIAAELSDVVTLGCEVTSVAAAGELMAVEHSCGMSLASSVVIAVPVNTLLRIRFTPALPDDVEQLARERHAGRVVKVWAHVPDSVAGDGSTGWPGMAESYTFHGGEGLALGGFLTASPSPGQQSDDFRREVEQRFPGLSLGALKWHDWNDDVHALGPWHCARPGQHEALLRLAESRPPIVFAGGDLSGEWVGWMDGAITSGRDAATKLHQFLRAVPPHHPIETTDRT